MAQSPVLVVGVAGGVGTTTIAAAIGGQDGGVYRGQSHAQVVVCADTVVSVGLAHRAIAGIRGRPVLVIVAATPSGMGRVAATRVSLVREQVCAVVHVPHITRWREVADPYAQAAAVRRFPQHVPRWLARFAQRVQVITERLGEGDVPTVQVAVRAGPGAPGSGPPLPTPPA